MKRLLVITYYWPPAGGVSVQRIIKFCKYLPKHGWQPIVLTADSGHFETIDHDNLQDTVGITTVSRVRAWEPHAFYRALGGRVGKRDPLTRSGRSNGALRPPEARASRLFEQASEWLRVNAFIPDSRIPWYFPAVKEGSRLIAAAKADAILSTAPPFTVHLVAKRLHELHGIPWIADFRDPWLENTVYNRVPRLGWTIAVNRRLERSVLKSADLVVCTGDRLAHLMRNKLYPGGASHVRVVGHGYDPDDVLDVVERPAKFWLSYFGSLYEQRFPDTLFSVVRDVAQGGECPGLAVRIYGVTTPGAAARLKELLEDCELELAAPLPQNEYRRKLYQPQVLLLSIDRVPNNDVITLGKAYDYLPTGNPILGVGPPTGDIASMLSETAAGALYDYDDRLGIKQFIVASHHSWKSGQLNRGPRRIPRWERSAKTAELASLLDQLSEGAD